MKVYFSLLYVKWRKWMPKNVIECRLKCKNCYWIWFMHKCLLSRANECIFALLVAISRKWMPIVFLNEQQKVYLFILYSTLFFWIDFAHVLATTGDMSVVALAIPMYNYTKIQGPWFERNYIIATDQKRDENTGTSFQSLPKINRMLITRLIYTQ